MHFSCLDDFARRYIGCGGSAGATDPKPEPPPRYAVRIEVQALNLRAVTEEALETRSDHSPRKRNSWDRDSRLMMMITCIDARVVALWTRIEAFRDVVVLEYSRRRRRPPPPPPPAGEGKCFGLGRGIVDDIPLAFIYSCQNKLTRQEDMFQKE